MVVFCHGGNMLGNHHHDHHDHRHHLLQDMGGQLYNAIIVKAEFSLAFSFETRSLDCCRYNIAIYATTRHEGSKQKASSFFWGREYESQPPQRQRVKCICCYQERSLKNNGKYAGIAIWAPIYFCE